MNYDSFIGKKLQIKWNQILDGGKMIREQNIIYLIISYTNIPSKYEKLLSEYCNLFSFSNIDDLLEIKKNVKKETILILKKVDGWHEDPDLDSDLLFFNVKRLENSDLNLKIY